MDYHNEIDPYCARWLRNLMKAGHIPQGFVDERDIRDVKPMDLWGFDRCHFFSGLGGWPYALRLAGVPDNLPLWTGSCPCQPFSAAGQRKGAADERHLWPYWHHLIEQSSPAIVLGEQVSSPEWLAGVRDDMEALPYAFGAADLPAACAGAPHCRQRYFFVAIAESQQVGVPRQPWIQPNKSTSPGVGIANSDNSFWWDGPLQVGWNAIEGEVERSGRKYRAQWRLKPGLPIVAHGVSDRMAKVRALGNSIVPQVAAAFIEAALDLRPVRMTPLPAFILHRRSHQHDLEVDEDMTPDQLAARAAFDLKLARPWLAARNAAIGEGQRRAWADAEKRASRLKAVHATRRRNRRNPDFEVSDNGWWKRK